MQYNSQAHLSPEMMNKVVYTMVTRQRIHGQCIIVIATFLFVLSVTIANHYVLAYTETGEQAETPSTMFFKVLEGDLNVCSPEYRYNVTVCQLVMKEDELLSHGVKEVASNITKDNITKDNVYPPLSIDPEMVVNEQQLQDLLTNRSLNSYETDEIRRHSDIRDDNATIVESTKKNYVEGYPEYEPLVTEQPLEEETMNKTVPQKPEQQIHHQEQLSFEDETISGELHQQDEIILQDKNDGHSQSYQIPNREEEIEDSKTDTSNLYSSISVPSQN